MRTLKLFGDEPFTGRLEGFGSFELHPGVFYNIPDPLMFIIKKKGLSYTAVDGGLIEEAVDVVFDMTMPPPPKHEDPDDHEEGEKPKRKAKKKE